MTRTSRFPSPGHVGRGHRLHLDRRSDGHGRIEGPIAPARVIDDASGPRPAVRHRSWPDRIEQPVAIDVSESEGPRLPHGRVERSVEGAVAVREIDREPGAVRGEDVGLAVVVGVHCEELVCVRREADLGRRLERSVAVSEEESQVSRERGGDDVGLSVRVEVGGGDHSGPVVRLRRDGFAESPVRLARKDGDRLEPLPGEDQVRVGVARDFRGDKETGAELERVQVGADEAGGCAIRAQRRAGPERKAQEADGRDRTGTPPGQKARHGKNVLTRKVAICCRRTAWPGQ